MFGRLGNILGPRLPLRIFCQGIQLSHRLSESNEALGMGSAS